ncbi:redoxin domain-containing protein [Flavobacteriaceae bacterium R38]|nr:redoxin domain-containing protein [Flavobacteriaceae bacterium R38]
MKNISLILLAFMALVSCETTKENEYKISASIEGSELEGKKVFLKKVGPNNQPVSIDSTEVLNGKFSFKGIAEVPELHYVFIDEIQNPVGVILEEGNIKITAYKDSIGFSVIGGTTSNDDFYSYVSGQREIGKKVQEIRSEFQAASIARDSVTARTLSELYQETVAEAREYEPGFIEKNPTSYISALLLDRMFAGQVITAKEAKVTYDKFSDKVKRSRVGEGLGKALVEILEAENRVAIGSIAPNFSAITPTGETLSLDQAKGKVTIIDFWAAWCKPCRVENPRVVAIYNKYHDQGLNILGVSLDRTNEDWLKAIEEDQLPWSHISNLKYWQDPIAKMYNVRGIPATFILDAEGRIVARNLRGPALEAKVTELLNISGS